MPIPENPHTPLVHHAPGTDTTAPFVPGPKAETGNPIVHEAPVADESEKPAIAKLYEELEAESKRRNGAPADGVKSEDAASEIKAEQ